VTLHLHTHFWYDLHVLGSDLLQTLGLQDDRDTLEPDSRNLVLSSSFSSVEHLLDTYSGSHCGMPRAAAGSDLLKFASQCGDEKPTLVQ
jgi:hypothetical protein